MKRSPLSFATHVSWPVSSRQHHQMSRLTDEKSRPSEPGRRVIGVTRWKGPGASQCVARDRSSPSQSDRSGCYIDIISPVTRAVYCRP